MTGSCGDECWTTRQEGNLLYGAEGVVSEKGGELERYSDRQERTDDTTS